MPEETLLMDEIIKDIHEGKYGPNEKLPSEYELADKHKVPRMVVRKAYEKLQQMGYVYSKQGKGSYAKDRKKQIPLLLSGDVSFSEKMKELFDDFKSINAGCEAIRYQDEIFEFLGAERDERVYKVSRLRVAEGRPIALHTSFIAESQFPDISEAGHEITSIYAYYRSKGYQEFSSRPSVLNIIFPSEYERNLLECPSLIPLLMLESGCYDKSTGKVLEFTRSLYRGDCFKYVI